MAIKRISRAFKDINLSFRPHPVTKDLTILRNENAIKRSVRNLVQTIPTERFFNSVLGSDVRSSLFEFVDYGTASTIQDQIEIVIENFEPRARLVQINVQPFIERNGYRASISFFVVNTPERVEIETFLERLR